MIRSTKYKLIGIWIAAIVLLVAMLPVAGICGNIENDLGEYEIKLGKEAVDEIAKTSKFSTDEKQLARVRNIGNKIAAIANKTEIKAQYGNARITPFQYTFNVIEDDEINAFCVPGGFVYVCTGLLDFVQSDDELAGVLAHEITHASHHHMVYLLKKQSAVTEQSALILLAALLGGASQDVGNLMLGAQLYNIARINNYGREAERDADQGAVQYMLKAGYNPVGMLTFLERLAQKPELVKMGIYSSHPDDKERISNVKSLIYDNGIAIERWRTTKLAKIGVTSVEENGNPVVQVMLNDTVILKPTNYGETSAEQRAYEVANRLEQALKANLMNFDVKAGSDGVLYIRREAIMSVTEDDAKKMGKTPAEVAEAAAVAIRLIIWNLSLTTVR